MRVTAVQHPSYEMDIINDKPYEMGKHTYYDATPAISESTETYQTITGMLRGDVPFDLAELDRIKTEMEGGEIPRFLVKQAVQDSAQTRSEADDEWVNLYRFTCNFLMGTPKKERDVYHGVPDVQLGSWVMKSACKLVDHNGDDRFFPKRGEGTKDQKEICRDCPVADECLFYALGVSSIKGVWGGTSERERRDIRSRLESGLSGEQLGIYIANIRQKGLTIANKELNQAA